MLIRAVGASDVKGATKEILSYIRNYRDKKIIYFNGWSGFGSAPVLKSIEQELQAIKAKKAPQELCFDTIIYINCSMWENRRVMQRKIAKELQLDHETRPMFDKQDEEDDFNGVDHGSRDVVPSVSQVIAQTLVHRKFMMIFLNGSDEEYGPSAGIVTHQPWMRGIDLTVVTECLLYELFLQYSCHGVIGFDWVAHAPNYWMCDGIIKGDGAMKISHTLHQEIRWEWDAYLGKLFEKLMEDPKAPFLVVKDDISFFKKRSYRWIFLTSKNIKLQDEMKDILNSASSLFVALKKLDKPQGLPNGLLTCCNNLGVLILSHCAFSFVSPPFVQCHGLRFLGLAHCLHDNTSDEGENNTNWECLKGLWILDLRYTEWENILSEEKMDIMTNLRELNIDGLVCWQFTSRLQRRLPYLQKLRTIKPTHKAETTSVDCYNSFVDKKDLKILDLSGNKDIENLSTCLSMAKSLQMLILDGCDGLENVVVPDGLRSSLRTFSLDGYGPKAHWTSSFKVPLEISEPKQTPDADTRDPKTSKISLQGCKQLDNLFIRGLPNLVELDLSGCAIKVLDFTTMVVNVPALKRLFLLGCENLRLIRWGSSDYFMNRTKLELLCIDTRPKRTFGLTRPSLAKHKHFRLQLHAILADARLARCLFHLYQYDVCFNIHITSSTEIGVVSQFDAARKEITELGNQRHHFVVSSWYGDVTTKISNAPMLVFPQPPTQPLDRHIEISGASHSLDSELEFSDWPLGNLALLMRARTESLHVHDVSTSASMPSSYWHNLKWCRVERCPNLGTVFPADATGDDGHLQAIWASDLLKAHCIWSKGFRSRLAHAHSFENLQHLHLRSCPMLQFVLPVWVPSFSGLETLHIIHCGNLMHVFALDQDYPKKIATHGLPFPKLTVIHLHDLPKLQQICEVKMLAPVLETIKIRGCWSLRRLPAVAAREPGVKGPTIEIEKNVWDALEWDGLAAGHHPNLFEPPVHSRYYRRNRLLRGTVNPEPRHLLLVCEISGLFACEGCRTLVCFGLLDTASGAAFG
ncbi:unnamed protein product [Urochloa decumbens]|uniref:Disease resistance protein At4g27190-like leucine-rich repeats domain-containing protein n=1 Tax=Urochloa decumbens TaxID=240449 RepID=A0ABC9D6H4_9POAL